MSGVGDFFSGDARAPNPNKAGGVPQDTSAVREGAAFPRPTGTTGSRVVGRAGNSGNRAQPRNPAPEGYEVTLQDGRTAKKIGGAWIDKATGQPIQQQ
jgi:hypothetical protein